MARNDEGDFELVMGNRQLLSGFFIVVILFGVFFTMGYIVGRHSSPAPINAGANPEPIPHSDTPIPPPAGQAVLAPAETSRPEDTPAAPETPTPVTSTQPATAPPEAPKPAPKALEKKPAPARTLAGSKIAEPAPGSYLQVLAPKRTAADGVVDSLRSKGITAVLAPGPTEDSVRILVGPLDSSSMGKMRADLESAGFKPFAKKY